MGDETPFIVQAIDDSIKQISSKFACYVPDIVSSDEKVAALTERNEKHIILSKHDWLTPHLHRVLNANAPSAGDIDENGVVNKVSLEAASRKLLDDLPTAFYNKYQLRQILDSFCARWGFHMKTRGCSILCHFGKVTNEDRRADYEMDKNNPHVSPALG
jgi:hypothetical protein